MSLRPTVDFLLYDWLKVPELQQRERFADHSRETFDAVLDTCERIAREKYAPFNRTVDMEEPRFDGEKVILPQATHDACKAYAESGMLSAAQDYAIGGMQLPYTVEAAANAFFAMASVSIGSGMLTTGNANLLMAHGTDLQKQVFALNEFNGRFSGTMCLSEPQAGSSLSDVATRAVPDGEGFESDPLGPRYRLRGNKMWISAGEHELTENIIHLVLAKIPGPDGKLAKEDSAETRRMNFDPGRRMTMGGAGLVASIDDYARFSRMLLGGGSLDGVKILNPSTVRLMATDQLDPRVTDRWWLPSKGSVGFGLDFAVRTKQPQTPEESRGAVGEFFWDGRDSTLFWVDPVNRLTAVFFVQTYPFDTTLHRDFRAAVYGPGYLGPKGD